MRGDDHVFTQVLVLDEDVHPVEVLDKYDGNLQIRMHGDRLMIFPRNEGEEGTWGLIVHGTTIYSLSEDEVELTGFRRVGDLFKPTWRPVKVVLTRPGTGWDEE